MVKLLGLALFRLLRLVLTVLYRFRFSGIENVPKDGPFVVLVTENSPIGIVCNAVALVSLVPRPLLTRRMVFFASEEFWGFPLLRFVFTRIVIGFPLAPQPTGQYTRHLLGALKHLRDGGMVIINPEGDMSRDGRPLPVRGGAAWLALHSGAPLVPVVPSSGAYDIWPPWEVLPSLRGRVVQRVGEPFRLGGAPMRRVTRSDLAGANARIRDEIDRLCYGTADKREWAGPATGHPPVAGRQPPDSSGHPAAVVGGAAAARGPDRRWGIPLLLWRCPICRTDDALRHEGPRWRSGGISCRGCGTRWSVARRQGKDFRLRVTGGRPGLDGLDMALSEWYEVMKRDFSPAPRLDLRAEVGPGESAWLGTSDVTLMAQRSSALFNGWTGSEAPRTDAPEDVQPGLWASPGRGRLILTDRRLIWRGGHMTLDFRWPSVMAVSLRLYHRFGVSYGATPYRFILNRDNGLKWLTYAAAAVRLRQPDIGHPVAFSPF